jgi:hypothetical protein
MGAPLTFVSIILTNAKQGTVMSNETKEAHAAETKVVRSQTFIGGNNAKT